MSMMSDKLSLFPPFSLMLSLPGRNKDKRDRKGALYFTHSSIIGFSFILVCFFIMTDISNYLLGIS